MQLNYLEVNGNLEEITCHGSPAFPMEVYLDNLDLYPNRFIPWHWHKELEFVYVLEGAIEFQTGVGTYVLSGGREAWFPLTCSIWFLLITASVEASTARCWQTAICSTVFPAD